MGFAGSIIWMSMIVLEHEISIGPLNPLV